MWGSIPSEDGDLSLRQYVQRYPSSSSLRAGNNVVTTCNWPLTPSRAEVKRGWSNTATPLYASSFAPLASSLIFRSRSFSTVKAGRRSHSTWAVYSGWPGFRSQARDQLSRLKVSWYFSVPLRKCRDRIISFLILSLFTDDYHSTLPKK
jgi:hypothetical protein